MQRQEYLLLPQLIRDAQIKLMKYGQAGNTTIHLSDVGTISSRNESTFQEDESKCQANKSPNISDWLVNKMPHDKQFHKKLRIFLYSYYILHHQ